MRRGTSPRLTAYGRRRFGLGALVVGGVGAPTVWTSISVTGGRVDPVTVETVENVEPSSLRRTLTSTLNVLPGLITEKMPPGP